MAGDDTFLRAVLSALQCKVDDACAAQEAALTEASQSKQDCAAALATSEYSSLVFFFSAILRHADLVQHHCDESDVHGAPGITSSDAGVSNCCTARL